MQQMLWQNGLEAGRVGQKKTLTWRIGKKYCQMNQQTLWHNGLESGRVEQQKSISRVNYIAKALAADGNVIGRMTKTLAEWTAGAKELAEMTRNGLAEFQRQRKNQSEMTIWTNQKYGRVES